MSNRGDLLRVRARFEKTQAKQETRLDRFLALMGDGEGNLAVPGKPLFVYVRVLGRGVVECLNQVAALRNDLPIIVGYDFKKPDTLQVLSIYEGGMSSFGPYAYLPAHHQAHEFRNADGGDDVVWIQKQAVIPLLCRPTSPISMFVEVLEDNYPWLSSWNLFPGATSADLTARIPAGAGEARFVLIYVDGATNLLGYSNGAIFPAAWPPGTAFSLVPAPPAGSVPVAAIYLTNGITAIDWANIYDLRLFNQPIGGSVTPGPHALLDSAVHSDTVTNTPPARGSLVVADATLDWDELLIGTAQQLLKVNAGGTDPEWGEPPITSIAGYVRGSIFRGGAADWEVYDAKTIHFILVGDGVDIVSKAFDWDDMSAGAGADMVHDHTNAAEGGLIVLGFPAVAGAGYALVSDGVNSWAVDQTPLWTGEHSFEDGIAFTGATGINSITIPDGLVSALYIIDDGFYPIEYLCIDTYNYYFLIDPVGVGIDVGIGCGSPGAYLHGVPGLAIFGATSAGLSLANNGVSDKDWLIYTDNDDLKFYESGAMHAAGNVRVTFRGSSILPTGVSGQDLGDATHRWDLYTQEVYFGGASGANEITVPDDTAIALELLDAGGLEYMRIVSTNANPYFLIDPAGAGIQVGIGTATPGTDTVLVYMGAAGELVVRAQQTGAGNVSSALFVTTTDDSQVYFGSYDDAYNVVAAYAGKNVMQGGGGSIVIAAFEAGYDIELYAGQRVAHDVILEDGGNFGIGPGINPGYRLHVSDSVDADYITKLENTHADGMGVLIVTNNTEADRNILRCWNGASDVFLARNDGVIKMSGLAGVGARAVVAAADGTLSAP